MSETYKIEVMQLALAVMQELTRQGAGGCSSKQLDAISRALYDIKYALETTEEEQEDRRKIEVFPTVKTTIPPWTGAKFPSPQQAEAMLNAFRGHASPQDFNERHPISIPLPAEYITPEHFPRNLRNFIAENVPEGYELHHVKMGPDANAACKAYEDTGRLYGIQTVAMPKPGCSLYLVPITLRNSSEVHDLRLESSWLYQLEKALGLPSQPPAVPA